MSNTLDNSEEAVETFDSSIGVNVEINNALRIFILYAFQVLT